MKKDIVILCCGDQHKAREIAETLSRKCTTTGAVIVLEDKVDDFMEQCVDGFQLLHPSHYADDIISEDYVIIKEDKPKYLYNGKLKRR